MTFEEHALEERAQHAAKAVNKAAKNLYENAKDKAHDAVETVNEAAKNLNEVAKEQWSKITEDAVENCGKDLGDLVVGVGVAAGLTFVVYGICRIVDIFDKVEDVEVDVNVRVDYDDEQQNEEKYHISIM